MARHGKITIVQHELNGVKENQYKLHGTVTNEASICEEQTKVHIVLIMKTITKRGMSMAFLNQK